MRVIYGFGKVKKIKPAVVVLGVFDGLHRGHLKIIKQGISLARRIKGKCLVVTFYPHPQRQDNLYSLEHRIKLLRRIGIDICLVVKFTRNFSRISAPAFLQRFLLARINPNYVLVGENFTFGRGGRAGPKLLGKYAQKGNFRLKVIPILKLKNRIISATYIRRLIIKGRLKQAAFFLGRPVSILGTVVKGNRLANTLGFPTANLKPHHEIIPPAGVYAVRVNLKNRKFKGACYIGRRPTFKGGKKSRIEVHIFGLKGNVYGKTLEVEFVKKLRKEKKFPSLELLASQVKKDIKLAISV